jgi:tRNA acetyltransferase TAN1
LLGVKEPKICKSGIKGVILVRVNKDPHELVHELRNLLHERPWEFRNIKRVIPVDKIVSTEYDEIAKESWDSAKNIPEESTFRVQVKKRYTKISSRKLIELIASKINRRVDLDSPDYIVNVEILGDITAIGLIRNNEILSVEKELLK